MSEVTLSRRVGWRRSAAARIQFVERRRGAGQLATWRESRVVPQTGRTYPPGWYGIEVMDDNEVDAVIVKMMPELDPHVRPAPRRPEWCMRDVRCMIHDA